MDEQKFCGECEHLDPTEKEQDLSSVKGSHLCRKYGVIVRHAGYHPKILKFTACQEITTLQAENSRLRQWVNDLQSGMYVNCVYCGHRYGPESEVPASMAEVLKQHIEQCPEHPMSKLKSQLVEAVKALKIWQELSSLLWSYERSGDARAYEGYTKLANELDGLAPKIINNSAKALDRTRP